MSPEAWIGLGGAAVMIAAGVVRRKVRRRWAAVTTSVVAFAGWVLMVQFVIKPLVSGPALAVIILGGITVVILLTAVIGGRAKQAEPEPPGRDDRRPPADL
jgi:peptidoglycan/LPS O-acetylase OafA/YrhL